MPAVHTNTLPDGTAVGLAAGLVINIDATTIYHLGDTALFSRTSSEVVILKPGESYSS